MRFFLALFLFSFISCSPKLNLPVDHSNFQIGEDIKILSDDKMKGRETGSQGEMMAARYIAERFNELGLQPKGGSKPGGSPFFQAFTGYESAHPHGDATGDKTPIPGRNVIGFIDHKAEKTVVIGGHYDHLGMGGMGSLHHGPDEIHNGADDNASGIAVMLYLADILRKREFKARNYLFIAFSGEEKGLWGSNYWTKNPTYPLKKIDYMINFDMVGRLEENKLAINGTGTSPQWKVLDKVNQGFELVKSDSGIGPSDHSSFYLVDIPAIHFFTGHHEDYHKPSDDFEKVNIEGCYQIGDYVAHIVYALRNKDLQFTKTKNESTEVSDFKVTLGVIPDYMYNEVGMRIDGVREGRTASLAGLEDGDIVLKMGDFEIKDMMGYMKALSEFEIGQTIPVEIKRGEKILVKSVTFQ